MGVCVGPWEVGITAEDSLMVGVVREGIDNIVVTFNRLLASMLVVVGSETVDGSVRMLLIVGSERVDGKPVMLIVGV